MRADSRQLTADSVPEHSYSPVSDKVTVVIKKESHLPTIPSSRLESSKFL